MIAWCNIAISSLAVTHCKSTSLVCVDLPLVEVSFSPCPLQSFAGSVSLPIRLPLFQWRRKILVVGGAVSVAACIAHENLTTPTFRKDHAHFEYSVLFVGCSYEKKRAVSQAEYALQLLIHEISHDNSCQIYIFEVQQ